jgi:hypothetical protein
VRLPCPTSNCTNCIVVILHVLVSKRHCARLTALHKAHGHTTLHQLHIKFHASSSRSTLIHLLHHIRTIHLHPYYNYTMSHPSRLGASRWTSETTESDPTAAPAPQKTGSTGVSSGLPRLPRAPLRRRPNLLPRRGKLSRLLSRRNLVGWGNPGGSTRNWYNISIWFSVVESGLYHINLQFVAIAVIK